jgi:hypothetical protein
LSAIANFDHGRSSASDKNGTLMLLAIDDRHSAPNLGKKRSEFFVKPKLPGMVAASLVKDQIHWTTFLLGALCVEMWGFSDCS